MSLHSLMHLRNVILPHSIFVFFVLFQADQNVVIAGTTMSQPCTPLFTENDSSWNGKFTKDAFHRHVVNGDKSATNPENCGTKAGLWCVACVILFHPYLSFSDSYLRQGLLHSDDIVHVSLVY